MNLIEARSISASYHGGEPVFADLSIAVAANENVAILGPSGSGKSTLLKILAGIKQPDSGTIVLAEASRGRKLTRGLMFQHSLLLPWLSVGANVALGARYDGNRADPSALLASVGLHGFESRRPETLSGGQRQRAALARALAHKPDVLLLDEPFSALDAELRTSLRTLVRECAAQRGRPVVLVTHQQEDARALDGRIVQMEELVPPILPVRAHARELAGISRNYQTHVHDR